nr:unnamed protein product [Callosobruchus analis]
MVIKCCVPNCTRNYKSSGRNVYIFKFPKDKDLREKWLRSIHRENSKISFHSVVCHLHFVETDILHTTSEVDWKTGKTLTVNLKKPKLKPNAIASVFPNAPSYLSKTVFVREDPVEKRQSLEASYIQEALFDSIETSASLETKFSISSYDELLSKTSYVSLNNKWEIIKKSDS